MGYGYVSLPEGTWGNKERFHNLVDSSPMSPRGVKVTLQFHEAGSTAKKPNIRKLRRAK